MLSSNAFSSERWVLCPGVPKTKVQNMFNAAFYGDLSPRYFLATALFISVFFANIIDRFLRPPSVCGCVSYNVRFPFSHCRRCLATISCRKCILCDIVPLSNTPLRRCYCFFALYCTVVFTVLKNKMLRHCSTEFWIGRFSFRGQSKLFCERSRGLAWGTGSYSNCEWYQSNLSS